MSLTLVKRNRVQLPQELLSLAKDHMRVTFDDDDRIIVHKLAHAIDLFEKLTQFTVFATEWTWEPGALPAAPTDLGLEAGSVALPVPVVRVGSFTAKDEADADVTGTYYLTGDTDPDSISPQSLAAASGSTTQPTVTLKAGYAAAGEMPPMIVDIILRIVAYLYEFREVQNVPGVDNVAYANSLLAHYWVPRC